MGGARDASSKIRRRGHWWRSKLSLIGSGEEGGGAGYFLLRQGNLVHEIRYHKFVIWHEEIGLH